MAYIDFWKRWKDFSGKTSRSDYWLALITHVILSFFLMIAMCITLMFAFHLTPEKTIQYFDVIWNIHGVIWTVPYLAMTVRRLRDAGYNRKNFWKLLIPGVGLIALFTRHFDDNTEESNHK